MKRLKYLLLTGALVVLVATGCSSQDDGQEDVTSDVVTEDQVADEQEENGDQSVSEQNVDGDQTVSDENDPATEKGEEASKDEALLVPKNEETAVPQDEDLTGKVKEEPGVIDGQVYTQNDMAIGTLIIEEGVSQGDIDALVEKYAKAIKENYSDKMVNVQAVQGGENKASYILE